MGMAPHSLSFWVPPPKKMKVGTSPRPRPVTFFQVMACVDASHFGHRAVELTEIIGTAHLPLRCLHPSHPTSWGVRCVGNLRSCSDRDNLWDGVKIPWWVLVVPPVYNGADCSFFANSSSPNRPFFFPGFHPNFPNKMQGHRLTSRLSSNYSAPAPHAMHPCPTFAGPFGLLLKKHQCVWWMHVGDGKVAKPDQVGVGSGGCTNVSKMPNRKIQHPG